MSARFEELGWQQTPMGVISLRRRFDPSVRADVYEVKLGDEYLMSSLFTVAEKEWPGLAWHESPDRLWTSSLVVWDWATPCKKRWSAAGFEQ